MQIVLWPLRPVGRGNLEHRRQILKRDRDFRLRSRQGYRGSRRPKYKFHRR